MDAITQHRKKRLQQLIDAAPYDGDRAAFMKKAELTKGRISQLLDPEEAFGELSAGRLCKTLGLSEGWFEQGAPGKPMAWPFVLLSPDQAHALDKDNRETVEKFALKLLTTQKRSSSSYIQSAESSTSGHRTRAKVPKQKDVHDGGSSDKHEGQSPRKSRRG